MYSTSETDNVIARLRAVTDFLEMRNLLIDLCPNYVGRVGAMYEEIFVEGFPTRQGAERELCSKIVGYVLGQSGSIYWRDLPEMNYREDRQWAAYARLVRDTFNG